MKEGKIINFDGYAGEIVSDDDNYIFLKDDLKTDIKVGDYVRFEGEEVHNIKRAYFIKNKKDDNSLSLKVTNYERKDN